MKKTLKKFFPLSNLIMFIFIVGVIFFPKFAPAGAGPSQADINKQLEELEKLRQNSQ